MRVDLVLWSGEFGGAESFTASLAAEMKRQGHDVRVVFVTNGRPLVDRLDQDEVPWVELGLARGGHVVGAAARFGDLLRDAEVALLPSSGFLAAAARIGGFRGALVAVEHNGTLLDRAHRTRRAELRRTREELLGMWAVDAQVAVSDALADHLRGRRRSGVIEVIHNGVPLPVREALPHEAHRVPVAGAAGRLIEGKGYPELIEAVATAVASGGLELRIAGSGPLWGDLRLACERLGVSHEAILVGPQSDMSRFWGGCDIAVVPSNECVESFGMVAIEAMALGLPVVATSQPALAQVVVDGVTGTLVEPGCPDAMNVAIVRYAQDEELRLRHGVAGRQRAAEEYDIVLCARRYADLLERVLSERRRRQ
jgi:glycosyltransferase involved in cell wall biosynthesis